LLGDARAERRVQYRARDAGYHGTVAETVAINQSFAINDLDVMRNWYSRPDYYWIMSNCANMSLVAVNLFCPAQTWQLRKLGEQLRTI
jgi:hypothetical protein